MTAYSRIADATGTGVSRELDRLIGALADLPRQALACIVESVIERLDALDGDPDLEDDDPAGDPADWGEPDDCCP